ncbi:MAG: hypothetical protein ACRD07_21410 [Acidimicrobiales bacterium]
MPSSSPDFYPPEFTRRSRAVLQRVHEVVPDAVLIGGWGTWVRTRGAMSHDIDLIVTHAELAALRAQVNEMSESRHLAGRKWRGTLDGIHLDLYVPHQSQLGQHLALRTEHLVAHTEILDGWVVLEPPAHLATKLAALVDRPDSAPGEKDRHEIIALLGQGIDSADAVRVVHDASARDPREVTRLIAQAFDYLGDLRLDRTERRALNQLAREWHNHSVRLGREAPASDHAAPGRRGPERGLPGIDM